MQWHRIAASLAGRHQARRSDPSRHGADPDSAIDLNSIPLASRDDIYTEPERAARAWFRK